MSLFPDLKGSNSRRIVHAAKLYCCSSDFFLDVLELVEGRMDTPVPSSLPTNSKIPPAGDRSYKRELTRFLQHEENSTVIKLVMTSLFKEDPTLKFELTQKYSASKSQHCQINKKCFNLIVLQFPRYFWIEGWLCNEDNIFWGWGRRV